MSFDKNNLDRLRKLARQLPKTLPIPQINSDINAKTQKGLHRIEIEEDPNTLFHELINASKDGKVPPHLITRLKEIENKKSQSNRVSKLENEKRSQPKNPKYLKNNEDLYTSFQMMLLEEEEDNDDEI